MRTAFEKETGAWPKRRAALAVCAACALCGCEVGPNYVRPAVDTTAAYKETVPFKPAAPRDAQARGKWWDVFNDPKLDALMSQVEFNNQTVKGAEDVIKLMEEQNKK